MLKDQLPEEFNLKSDVAALRAERSEPNFLEKQPKKKADTELIAHFKQEPIFIWIPRKKLR